MRWRATPAGAWSRPTGPRRSAAARRSWRRRSTAATAGTGSAEAWRRAVKIVALTAYHVRIPLRKPIRHASHTRTDTDNVLVRCALEDSTEGYGEGVPRDYVTGETIDSVLDLLKK